MIGPRRVEKPLVLYGYGRLGHLAEEIFKELEIPIAAIIERKTVESWPEKYAKGEIIGIPWYSNLVAVCVATEPFMPIKDFLQTCGYGAENIVPVWDVLEFYADRTGIGNGWIVGEITEKDIEKMRSLIWADTGSRAAYLCFWMWHKYRSELPGYPRMERAAPPLPSTLADIRARQRTETYIAAPIKKWRVVSIHSEGHELETIKKNMHLFKKYRPNIQAACYHSRDGLWKIQKALMENLPDYRWTFGLTAFMGQGAYITGVPKEKV